MAETRSRVLLLNPPHRKRVVRDCYCSDIVKAGYYWHPLDLLIQAGHLAARHDVFLFDAIAHRLSDDAVLDLAERLDPDWVLMLVGRAVADDDREFAEMLRESLPQAKLFASGDLFTARPVEALRQFPMFAGALLEFVSPEFARLVDGREAIGDVALREDDGIRVLTPLGPSRFSYPPPPLDLIDPQRYRLPFYGGAPFYSLLASYGCPYGCTFCHVPSLGYKHRDPEEVAVEMRLAYEADYQNFYLRDATFGVRRDDAGNLCERIARIGDDIRWNAFTRADLLDDELLDLMARSGCAVLQIGVETLDRDSAAAVNKRVDHDHLRRLVAACRRREILTSLHFILGLPGDQWSQTPQAVRDLIFLEPDYLSVNILAPRPGSAMNDDGLTLPAEQVQRLHKLARRINLRFYLRPTRIWAELKRLRSPREILRMLRLFVSSLLPERLKTIF
ncbi:MAG TPA: B12-binding domain-containing radical SAM protein [bacterium]|nr:B12-binding domain-containing radical SAM protein [bacterium]